MLSNSRRGGRGLHSRFSAPACGHTCLGGINPASCRRVSPAVAQPRLMAGSLAAAAAVQGCRQHALLLAASAAEASAVVAAALHPGCAGVQQGPAAVLLGGCVAAGDCCVAEAAADDDGGVERLVRAAVPKRPAQQSMVLLISCYWVLCGRQGLL